MGKAAAIIKIIDLCLPLVEKGAEDILPLIEKLVLALRKEKGVDPKENN